MHFTHTKADSDLMRRIAERSESLGFTDPGERLALILDLAATHANGNPMDFSAMLAGADEDFAHDIGGIRRHIDRETGQLGDCFSPRFSSRAEAQVRETDRTEEDAADDRYSQ